MPEIARGRPRLPEVARGYPIDSMQAIRKRTRAGMGGCQGKPWNYGCECRVARIIERETSATSSAQATHPHPYPYPKLQP